jgi:hypothetical protein
MTGGVIPRKPPHPEKGKPADPASLTGMGAKALAVDTGAPMATVLKAAATPTSSLRVVFMSNALLSQTAKGAGLEAVRGRGRR